jgi:hypothetical protein
MFGGNLAAAERLHYPAERPGNLAGRPPISPIFSLLFGTTLFLSLHHRISEHFLTWCSKAHQVRYNICFQLLILLKKGEPILLFLNEKGNYTKKA